VALRVNSDTILIDITHTKTFNMSVVWAVVCLRGGERGT